MKEQALQEFISAATAEAIDLWLTKFPADERRSGLIFALTKVQDDNGGWLSNQHVEAVAEYLGVPKIAAFEVATFYTMFDLKPCGKYKISVCTNVSCLLNNSETIVRHLQKKLNLKFNETSADLRYTLKEVECLAACQDAPVLQIGKTYYPKMTVEKLDTILEQLP